MSHSIQVRKRPTENCEILGVEKQILRLSDITRIELIAGAFHENKNNSVSYSELYFPILQRTLWQRNSELNLAPCYVVVFVILSVS